jgi:hypothetical protein
MMRKSSITLFAVITLMFIAGASRAQEPTPIEPSATTDSDEDLAKKLANPIANLISVPFQYNYDTNYGPNDKGSKSVLNIQPVAPFSLNENWNVITRTIIPLAFADDVPFGSSESGLGDIVASQFFSPKKPTAGGLIWGVGPVELLPTASDNTLGGGKFGLGPTFVVLQQNGPWTIGLLANHIWSCAGDDDRADINATFLQPFVSYITKTKTTFSLNTESTYDWKADKWTVPVNFSVSQLLKIGDQIISVGAGVRYWAESPANGPEGWGGRLVVTFLFPK